MKLELNLNLKIILTEVLFIKILFFINLLLDNNYQLIFLPLMNRNQKIVERVKETIELEKKLEVESNLKNNLVAMTFVLSDKFLSDQEISEIWRDNKMVRIFKYAEEQGEKKGERKLFKTLVKVILKAAMIKSWN